MIIQPTKRLSILDTTDPFTQPGLLAMGDGSYLFGYTHDVDPGTMIWYRSTDSGITWTLRGSGRGTGNFDMCLPTRAKNDIAVYPSFDYLYDHAYLNQSTNGGATWAITGSFPSADSNAWECFAVCSCSLANTGILLAGGQFEGSQDNPQALIAVSTNGGATWTPSTALTATGQGSFCAALAPAGNGVVFAGVNIFDGTNYQPELFRSDDNGAHWTDLGPLPLTASALGAVIYAATCPQLNKVCISGQQRGSAAAGQPGAWYSHDNGATINLVAGSDIVGFPTGVSYPPECREIKRLTRDAVLLCFDPGDGAAAAFFAVSLDDGATYEKAPAAPLAGWQEWCLPSGASVVTRDGNILIPVFRWPNFGESYHEVYSATITC